MHDRIANYLNQANGTNLFTYLIPDHAIVYTIMFGWGVWLFMRRSSVSGLNLYHASGLLIWGTIGAVVGARLFYLIQNITAVFHHPAMLLEINGATVSWGVYLGGVGGVLAYCYKHQVIAWTYLDVLASVMGIGPMLGRLACFLNGDDYGTISYVPWAVSFPHGSYPFVAQVKAGILDPLNDLSLSVHPVQLYGCLKGFLLLVVFSILWAKKLFKPGILFMLYWMGYSVLRFGLEFFRGDTDRGWIGPLSTGQVMSILIFTISGIALIALNKKQSVSRQGELSSTNFG